MTDTENAFDPPAEHDADKNSPAATVIVSLFCVMLASVPLGMSIYESGKKSVRKELRETEAKRRTTPECKFTNGQRVRITSGFRKGESGRVIDAHWRYTSTELNKDYAWQYTVSPDEKTKRFAIEVWEPYLTPLITQSR